MDKQPEKQEPANTQAGPNPTLHDKGTRVPDYGNVMGGSSDVNAEQGQEQANTERSGSGKNDTQGNP